MTVADTIFVPDIGFRPAEVVIARVPVTRAEAGRTVTVERAVAGPSGVDVVLTITGQPSANTNEMPPFASEPVTIREEGGRSVSQVPWRSGVGRISGPPSSVLETVRRGVTLEPLSPGTRRADLSVSGVTVPLEFEPATVVGVPTFALDAIVERHGIAVAARRIAFLPDSTAIELTVSLHDERSAMYMIGMSLGPNACDVGLRDDAGRVYGGQRTLGDGRRGRDFRDVAVFPALPADVRTVSLEIADVTIVEQTDDLTLPVGFDGEIRLGGLTGHAKVLRESDETRALRRERLAARLSALRPGREPPPDEDARRIEVECGDRPWIADRRLIRPISLWLTDRRPGCSTSFSDRGWVLSVPDPSDDTLEVTISSALVQYRGPWRMEIALPPRG